MEFQTSNSEVQRVDSQNNIEDFTSEVVTERLSLNGAKDRPMTKNSRALSLDLCNLQASLTQVDGLVIKDLTAADDYDK
jgi:hypothetical protein